MSYQKESTSEAYNIKEFILSALPYKYFYLASFVVCIAVAFMINKLSPTIVRVTSIIGPIEDKRPSLRGSSEIIPR